ncbi:MAG: hypothetical protein IJ867_01740 [Clostridia bacterium]|nr:hypothetical protein [Clostridia bacterium]
MEKKEIWGVVIIFIILLVLILVIFNKKEIIFINEKENVFDNNIEEDYVDLEGLEDEEKVVFYESELVK